MLPTIPFLTGCISIYVAFAFQYYWWILPFGIAALFYKMARPDEMEHDDKIFLSEERFDQLIRKTFPEEEPI